MSRDYRVGLFMIVGVVVLGILVMMYGREPFWLLTTRYALSVYVHNPTGIREGTPAFLQGVPIGRVDSIEFRDPKRPRVGAAVILGIDKQYDVPKGWEATIHPVFGFGQGAIHIHPPEIEAVDDAEGIEPLPKLAKDGSASMRGKMANALESVVPQEYIETLGKAVTEIANMAGNFSRVLDDIHELTKINPMDDVDDPNKNIPANAYTLIQRLNKTLSLFNTSFAEGGDLHVSLIHAREWLEKLDARTESLLSQADGSLNTVDGTLNTIEKQFTEVSQALLDVTGRLSKTLDEAHLAARTLNEGKGALGLALYDPRLYEEMVFSIEELQRMMMDIRTLVTSIQTDGLKTQF